MYDNEDACTAGKNRALEAENTDLKIRFSEQRDKLDVLQSDEMSNATKVAEQAELIAQLVPSTPVVNPFVRSDLFHCSVGLAEVAFIGHSCALAWMVALGWCCFRRLHSTWCVDSWLRLSLPVGALRFRSTI